MCAPPAVDRWWAKYRLLGDFPDAWFGGHAPIPECFHLVCRDVVGRLGDREEARALFERSIALADAHEADAQVEHGACVRVSGARDMVRGGACEREHVCTLLGTTACLLPASRQLVPACRAVRALGLTRVYTRASEQLRALTARHSIDVTGDIDEHP